MGKTTFVLGAAVGYVLGARAGRSSYDQIVAQASRLWGNPKVQETVSQAKDTAVNSSAAQAIKEKLPSSAGGTSSSGGGTGGGTSTSSGTSTSGTGTSGTGTSGTGTSSGPVTSPVVDPVLNTPSTTGQPGTKTPSTPATPATPGTAFPHGV